MSDLSARLALPFIAPSQAQKHVTHNEALQQLDLLVQMRVESFGDTTPPSAPFPGTLYALGTGAQGTWAGQDGQLAAFLDENWLFIAPQEGWLAIGSGTGELRIYRNGDWHVSPERLDRLGIGTTADAVNRLALTSDAALFSHDGAGHQLKINKATDPDTASLVFQSNWIGHAETGLAGNNDFAIKVSADGAVWTDALTLDQSTGQAGGAAVQADAFDTMAGRLLQVGAFGIGLSAGQNSIPTIDMDATDIPSGATVYGAGTTLNKPGGRNGAGIVWRGWGGNAGHFDGTGEQHQMYGARLSTSDAPDLRYRTLRIDNTWSSWAKLFHTANILGTVSQVGGVPTGAIIERGSNANGSYVRFADGTQICWVEIDDIGAVNIVSGAVRRSASIVWSAYPATFVSRPVVHWATRNASGASWMASDGTAVTQSVPGGSFLMRSASDNTTTYDVVATAIGRWF